MANKVIQICGTNGAGKTTLMKSLLSRDSYDRCFINVDGVEREYWRNINNNVVIGKYCDNNCCGVDAGDYSGDALIRTIIKVACSIKPFAILFEDMRFGASYTFKEKLMNATKLISYDYVSIALIAPPEVVCDRVYMRSKNADVNYDSIIQRQMRVIRSNKKIHGLGAKCLYYDTNEADHNVLVELLHKTIGQFNNGVI